MDPAHVLLVEDDEPFRLGLRSTLSLAGYRVSDHGSARPAMAALSTGAATRSAVVDLVLADLRLPDLDGLELLQQIQRQDADLPVVVMTAHADIETAVRAIRQGAYDFVEKPFGRDRLLTLVQRAVQQRQLTQENRRLRSGVAAGAGLAAVLVGASEAMRHVRELLLQVAATPVDVLVVGETGTGKERVARALHDFSGRRGPFVAINCAALPEALMESELFGHERGAFTGATQARVGRIEYAHQGTLFLDEVEAMPASLQAKLLRVLQEREVQRLGANRVAAVDIRVVAASNQDPADLVQAGQLRADLFYRLDTVRLHLPPLRERPGDILPLFEHFRGIAGQRFEREARPLSPAVSEQLLAYRWPGNVREVRAAAERQVLGLPPLQTAAAADANGATASSLETTLATVEAQILADSLRRHQGRVDAASVELGISPATLYRKLKRLGLEPGSAAGSG
jgi:DNA-binding NtrC family response regulator